MSRQIAAIVIISLALTAVVRAGPYAEAGVNGYIGQDWRHADPADNNAVINPIFRAWATGVESYEPTPQPIQPWWKDPTKALGCATGDSADIVSLGDLNQQQIDQGVAPGYIVLSFNEPVRDVNGYDFVVFENGFISNFTNPIYGFVRGEMFAELAYVEVSSDGENFARFASVSLTAGLTGAYGTIEISNIFNLVGKHPNAGGRCTGTPFDLSDIADDPNVVCGVVDINNINFIRIVDVPGSGDFFDNAVEHADPNTWPDWYYYEANHPIYDAWVTFGSGGLDLEAIGVLYEQEYSADINLDGVVDTFDFILFASAWRSHFGQDNWIARCDLAEPKDYIIDSFDYAVFAAQWLQTEQWRSQ